MAAPLHIGLVTPDATGHLNPSLALGRALARRGHRVRIICAPRARQKVDGAGLELLPIGETEEANGQMDAAIARLATLKGHAALLFTGYLLARAADIYFRDLPPLVEREKFDGLLVDQAIPAAALIADRMDVPYVVLCNALPIHYDPIAPPAPTLWRYRTDLLGRFRNPLALFVAPPIFDRLTGAHRRGVSPLLLSFAHPPRGLAHVAQQPDFFDFPRTALPEHFHYTGPWHEPNRDESLPFPWDKLDGRPLVYASLGTVQNRLKWAYQAIIDAARTLDVQLVVSLGRHDASFDLKPAANSIVVPFAPQLELLGRAAVAVTHAGMNSALECLSQGVPMVCLPVTNDQPGVARRVEWVGAGEVLPIRRVTPARLRTLLVQVLGEPRYRERAQEFRDQIGATDGAEIAASIIERALAGRTRVFREHSVPRDPASPGPIGADSQADDRRPEGKEEQ